MISVEVAYALPTEQKIIVVQVEEGSCAYDAVARSRMAEFYPGIDINQDPMGIFGKIIKDPKSHILNPGDRVEIYRPLIIDPKDARAARAAKARAKKEQKAS